MKALTAVTDEPAAELAASEDLRREWRDRIAGAWVKTYEAIIEVGRLLVAAKKALPYGEFGKMVSLELPFSASTAQRLMAISTDRRITNAAHVQLLPPHWGTLYELSRLSDRAFEHHLAKGHIKPDMRREDAVALLTRPAKGRAARRPQRSAPGDIPAKVIDELNGTPLDSPAAYEALRKMPLDPDEKLAAIVMVKRGHAATVGEAADRLIELRQSAPPITLPTGTDDLDDDGKVHFARIAEAWNNAPHLARYLFATTLIMRLAAIEASMAAEAATTDPAAERATRDAAAD
jgi:hypothetical protein